MSQMWRHSLIIHQQLSVRTDRTRKKGQSQRYLCPGLFSVVDESTFGSFKLFLDLVEVIFKSEPIMFPGGAAVRGASISAVALR